MKEVMVIIRSINNYDQSNIESLIPDAIFDIIKPNDKVIIKPNWVKESHEYRKHDWDYVITHPSVIGAVFMKVLKKLGSKGRITITDGPQTDSSFKKIVQYYPIEKWYQLAKEKNVHFEIIDLREDEWISKGDVIVSRKKLPGDPRGSIETNLKGDLSEFFEHIKSHRGYYGADYSLKETNRAHDGFNNLYRISKTVAEADVFINIPKMKTHKKGGITCCLKNLVGINTYKNFLPHHSEGGPSEDGDQFPKDNYNARIEGPTMAFIKQQILQNVFFSKLFRPFKALGKMTFGDNNSTIRSGNWYGNDTLWRMVLDLNKVMYYSKPDGTLKENNLNNRKTYIGIVDGIKGGEGNGPLAPDPINSNVLIIGTNPVEIDAVSARLMGFDPLKIPSIKNAFNIKYYKLVDFDYNKIQIDYRNKCYSINDFPEQIVTPFRPHFGWVNHIEYL